jgi:protein-disulfide isomerase
MRLLTLLCAAMLWCVCPVAAQTPAAAAPSALNKQTLEEYVRRLFVWGPQIAIQIEDPKPAPDLPGFKHVVVRATAGQASQEQTFYVSNDGRRILRGTVYDVTQEPFAADRDKIKTDVQPSFGPPEAPVVAVVYSDFQCSFCKEKAKVIRQNLAAEYPAQVRVYFKDLPLEPIHPWAKPAAIAGRCIFGQKPAAFWEYHDWMFENQGEFTTENLNGKVLEWAKTKSLEPIQLGTCIETKATEGQVTSSQNEARELGVNSTPTLFINGRKLVGNVPWPQMKQIIDYEIEYQKTRGGDKCCELKIPSPVEK